MWDHRQLRSVLRRYDNRLAGTARLQSLPFCVGPAVLARCPDTLISADPDQTSPESPNGTDRHVAERPPRISTLSIVAPLILSLSVLGVIAYLTYDPSAYAYIAPRVNLWLVIAALGTVLTRVFFGAWRLRFISHGHLGWASGTRIQLIWDFLAYVTPSTLGGGPFVPFFIARERRMPVGEATSVILFAMLLDQVWFAVTIPLLLLSGRYAEIIPDVIGIVGYWSITVFFAGFMIWVLVFAYGTLVRPATIAWAITTALRLPLLRRFRQRAIDAMEDFQARARLLRSQSAGFYLKGFILTLLPWLSRYALVVLIIWSVFPELDVVLAFLRTIALSLASTALPLPGGAGGVEALYVLFLGAPLVPGAIVTPTLLAWRILSYYLFLVTGTFLLTRYLGSPPRSLSAASPQQDPPSADHRRRARISR